MAEQTKSKAKAGAKTAPKRKTQARKAPAKRKTAATRTTAAKRKPAAKKSTVRSSVRKVENKAAAYERDVRKAARKAEKQVDAAEKSVKKYAKNAQEASRRAFLASLGFYGKAFDQVQERFNSLQDQMETRRGKASDLYDDLVKRGEQLEADAREVFDDIDLPSLDREELEARLDQARDRFAELRASMGFKSAA